MRIGILSRDGWHYRDLKRAASDVHEMIRLDFDQMAGVISSEDEELFERGQPLSQFDSVLVRAMPAGSLEQIVTRMDMLYRLERLGVAVVNPAKSIEAAVDKYLSLCRLQDAGIPIPDSGAFQTAEMAHNFFHSHNMDVVFKPIFGSEGQGLVRLTTEQQARRLFAELEDAGKVIYLQRFLPDMRDDLRLFVVGEKVFGMARRNDNDWRKNVSLGGESHPHEPSPEEVELALASAAAVGTYIAGVDVLKDVDGRYQVLEVNSSPGWRAISKTTGVNIAREIIAYLTKTQN
jgi:ribosomal protein S6--L-glutamate ligase